MACGEDRDLSPAMGLAVAAGMLRLSGSGPAEREKLLRRIAEAKAAGLTGAAQELLAASEGYLAGTVPMQALSDVLDRFCTPFIAARCSPGRGRPPARPIPPGTTHAARVAEAVDPLDLYGEHRS